MSRQPLQKTLYKSQTANIHVSVGELFDKKSILEIKAEKLSNPRQLSNVMRELAYLSKPCDVLSKECTDESELRELVQALKNVNTRLWDLENKVRQLLRDKNLESEFVMAAQQIFNSNDERAQIKRAINELMNSLLIEEKFHS